MLSSVTFKNVKIMKNPKIKVKVKHSESKYAWNIVGDTMPGKYKIARIPYHQLNNGECVEYNKIQKEEALNHANFVAWCFNNSESIFKSSIMAEEKIISNHAIRLKSYVGTALSRGECIGIIRDVVNELKT